MRYNLCYMNKSDLSFLLKEIHTLTFVNPFGSQRDEIEERILKQLGVAEVSGPINPIFTKEFNQVLYWVDQAEQSLLGGMVKNFDSTVRAEQIASLAYFSLYHKLVDDFDSLINRAEGDTVSNRQLFKRFFPIDHHAFASWITNHKRKIGCR